MKEKLTTLASLPYSKAEILNSLLESAGIDCIIEKVDFLQNGMDTGVSIRIHEKDARQAFPILDQMMGKVIKDPVKRENYVLVPVDFSSYSVKAALIGFDIAEKLGAKMVLYHSTPQPEFLTIPYSDVIVYDSALFLNYEMTEKETTQKFEDFLTQLTALIDYPRWKKAKPEYIIKVGEPEDDILSYINIHPPKLVVMGIRGGDAQSDDLLGTTTASVFFNAKVPVLAIPEQTPDNWLQHFRKVAYATIFESNDFIAIDRLIKLMAPFDTKVICLHVDQGNNPYLDEAMLEGMKEALCEKYPQANFECHLLHHKDLPEAIDQFIIENQVDVLALTTHKRNLLTRLFNPSIARKMLLHTHTPLLIFHA
ncbi:MAG TPA: universal stress protein [Prolixibacteraceae bacterium]|jgi:nucleotide-binding universal stress UspA family protein